MEESEQKDDSTTSLSEDASVTDDNVDINDEMTSESVTCDKQSTENTENNSESSQNGAETCKDSGFKKPLLLIGPKRGKIGKIRTVNNNITAPSSTPVKNDASASTHSQLDTPKPKNKTNKPTEDSVDISLDMKNIPVPYVEPTWGGKPTEEYKFEILKSGMILGKIDLSEKSFHVIGRLQSCDMSLAHPTISRYHAIVQYREDDSSLKGFYLYDLESTHGTFWNGHRIKPRTYVRLHGGHMIKFGCSKRKYILLAPPDDEEDEIPQYKLSRTQSKVS